ncbi:unnamed protein product [Paramecium pentaurelia]|uniref:Uncharacterized protein n=1 Tax=Paramecium pentaurelia TaxID=43138 RepID=A0A8S1WNU5_9CILI|nr:unnamed protein product [Paramecium pentaurelia]
MKIQLILVLLIAVNTQSFLEESSQYYQTPFAPIMIQEDVQQQQGIETAMAPEQEYVYDPESVLQSAKEQQILIARNYEQNLPAKGDCIILYSECNFRGSSFKYCNKPDEILSFQLPIQSVYVPIGSTFQMTDAIEGNKINMLMSQNCILSGLHLPEPQLQEVQETGSSWFSELKDSEKAILDEGDLSTPKIQFFDNDGNVISREQYQKMVEEDAKRSYEILTGQTNLSSPGEQQPQQTATNVNIEEMPAEKEAQQQQQ